MPTLYKGTASPAGGGALPQHGGSHPAAAASGSGMSGMYTTTATAARYHHRAPPGPPLQSAGQGGGHQAAPPVQGILKAQSMLGDSSFSSSSSTPHHHGTAAIRTAGAPPPHPHPHPAAGQTRSTSCSAGPAFGATAAAAALQHPSSEKGHDVYQAVGGNPPRFLWVMCPEMPEASGRFALSGGGAEQVNGMPVWRNGGPAIYCNSGGGWMIGSDQQDVASNRGWIASKTPHGNAYPHHHAKWEVADGVGGWTLLSKITVSAAEPQFPPALCVTSAVHAEVSGVYTRPSNDTTHAGYYNGFPYWCCGDKRVYSGEGGWWLIDPNPKHMDVDRGLLASTSKHGGVSPNEMLSWEVADGRGGWTKDDRCSVRIPAPGAGGGEASAEEAPPHTTPPGKGHYHHHHSHGAATAVSSAGSDSTRAQPYRGGGVPGTPPPAGGSRGGGGLPGFGDPDASAKLKEEVASLSGELEQMRSSTLGRERKMMEEINALRDQVANAKATKGLLQSDYDAAAVQQQRLRSENLDLKAQITQLEASLATEKGSLCAADEATASLEAERDTLSEELASARATADSERDEAASAIQALEARVEVLLLDAEEKEAVISGARRDLSSAERLADSLRHEAAMREKMCSRLQKGSAKADRASRAQLEAEKKHQAQLRERIAEVERDLASTAAGLAQSNEVNAALTQRCQGFERRLEESQARLQEEASQRGRHLARSRAAAEATVRAAADSLLALLQEEEVVGVPEACGGGGGGGVASSKKRGAVPTVAPTSAPPPSAASTGGADAEWLTERCSGGSRHCSVQPCSGVTVDSQHRHLVDSAPCSRFSGGSEGQQQQQGAQEEPVAVRRRSGGGGERPHTPSSKPSSRGRAAVSVHASSSLAADMASAPPSNRTGLSSAGSRVDAFDGHASGGGGGGTIDADACSGGTPPRGGGGRAGGALGLAASLAGWAPDCASGEHLVSEM